MRRNKLYITLVHVVSEKYSNNTHSIQYVSTYKDYAKAIKAIKNNPAVISYNESNSNYIEYSTNEAEYTLAVLHNSDCTKFTQDVLFRQPEKESYEDWYNSNLYFDSCE